MKRLLALLVLLALCGAAQGLSLTFQNPSDFTEFVSCTVTTSGSCGWAQSATGMNSYVTTTANARTGPSYTEALVYNVDSISTTYASATLLSGGTRTLIRLYDSSMSTLYTYTTTSSVAGRYEIKMVGGEAKIYRNNVLIASSGALAQNPSHIGWGAHNLNAVSSTTNQWDNIVYGDTENKNIFSAPEQGYLIVKDLVNPASSGLAWPNGTVVNSYNMTATYGFGDTNESRTVILQNFGTGQTYSSVTTTAGTMSGSTAWPINDAIIASGAPYGYYVTTVLGSGEYSDVIEYRSVGGTVTFNAATYARGDTAAVTTYVDPTYWMPLTYGYRLDVMNVYGEVISTTPITTQSQISIATFESTDPLGVYYAVLYATPTSGGESVPIGSDIAELTGHLVVSGIAVYAPNGTPINGANISIDQNTVFDNMTTGVFGNYTTTAAFYSGSITTINATATGCYQYTYSFTPQEAKTLNVTIVLESPTAPHTGVAIQGVNRDTVYGNPISDLTDQISNSTHSEAYTVSPNPWGYYLLDESVGAYLTAGRVYAVTGNGTRYRPTSDQPYLVTAVGT